MSDKYRFDQAQTYLRQNDKIGGYVPLLGMNINEAKLWADLWTGVRRLDELSETGASCEIFTSQFGGELLKQYPTLLPKINDLSQWPVIERSLYGENRLQPMTAYFKLMYFRAFLPVYICSIISLKGESESFREALSMYIGYGAQLMDDTLDLRHDISKGRIFVTLEELEYLKISIDDLSCTKTLNRIAEFRNVWALYYYLRAYGVTNHFSLVNKHIARSWIEFGLRAILDRRIKPLPEEIVLDHSKYCCHFGIYMILFDCPFLSESWRYRILHPIVKRFIQTTSIVDINDANCLFAQHKYLLPKRFCVEQLNNRPVVTSDFASHVNTDDRRRLHFVHYGIKGVIPTIFDIGRIILGI